MPTVDCSKLIPLPFIFLFRIGKVITRICLKHGKISITLHEPQGVLKRRMECIQFHITTT
jgi:hypothetical protein